MIDELVLAGRHPVHDRANREPLRIKIKIVGHQLHQPLGVGIVVDRERSGDIEPADLRSQNANARGVKGGDPHQLGPVAHQVHHPATHLGRGLVGEGNGENRAWVYPALAHQIADPAGQHPSLARTGAGHHKYRAALVQHRLPLRWVQALEELFGSQSGRPGLRRTRHHHSSPGQEVTRSRKVSS